MQLNMLCIPEEIEALQEQLSVAKQETIDTREAMESKLAGYCFFFLNKLSASVLSCHV